MCCLKNEEDTYEYLNSRLPEIGDTVTLPDGGKGEVHSMNVLRQTVKVLIEVDDGKEMNEYPVSELKFKPRKRKNNKDSEREPKEEKGSKAPKEVNDSKEAKDPKEAKEPKTVKGPREPKESREQKEPRERRNNRHHNRKEKESGSQEKGQE